MVFIFFFSSLLDNKKPCYFWFGATTKAQISWEVGEEWVGWRGRGGGGRRGRYCIIALRGGGGGVPLGTVWLRGGGGGVATGGEGEGRAGFYEILYIKRSTMKRTINYLF